MPVLWSDRRSEATAKTMKEPTTVRPIQPIRCMSRMTNDPLMWMIERSDCRGRSSARPALNVATVTIHHVTDAISGQSWMLAVIRLPAGPSRHRVAVWRELRRIGAIPVGGGVWAAPGAPVFATGLDRVADLVRKGDGEMVMLVGAARDRGGRKSTGGVVTDG